MDRIALFAPQPALGFQHGSAALSRARLGDELDGSPSTRRRARWRRAVRDARKELEDSTNSFNSATILIADRRGREEILRALSGLPSSLRTRLASSLASQPAASPPGAEQATPLTRFFRGNWVEILLPGAVGLIIWLAFNYH